LAEWEFLSRKQKQELLQSTVAAIHFRRAEAGAAVTAVELSGSLSPVHTHSSVPTAGDKRRGLLLVL